MGKDFFLNFDYCPIRKSDKQLFYDLSLAYEIVVGCSTAYVDYKKKVDQQIEWAIDNFDNVNDVCLCNALEYVWSRYIGVTSTDLFEYIAESVAQKVIEGKVKEW